MMRKFTLLTLTLALSALVALAQTNPGTTAAAPQTRPAAPAAGGVPKIGVINLQQAVLVTNEGQRDFPAALKKLEPRRQELENLNKELETLRNELTTQGDKLNEAARGEKTRTLEQKQKAFQRNYEDYQQDAQAQQGEIVNRILGKLGPVIDDYAKKNGYALIVDVSRPWPDSPVVWWSTDAANITKEIVDLYNQQSGIPAPPPQPTTGAQGAGQQTRPAQPGQQQRPAQQQPARPGQPR